MSCEFVAELGKLRKLSQESVDNADYFDSFKRYMHIERPVEEELRILLRTVNESNKKALVMLCGSAGDGKSHLIAYLKNSDDEKLLEGYETYNDATESSAPTLTAMDTLAEKLAAFNDDNIGIADGSKMIIAINLGTLNNFIESEKGANFKKLKEYVDSRHIFSNYGQQSGYIENSIFQHVSFSDYQVFSLTANGIKTEFLELLFDKVFSKNESNTFYDIYQKCSLCTMRKKCPVCHNYEYLQEQNRQKAIIQRIAEVVIEDKAIVSTREILNFIYDILVHPEFSFDRLTKCSSSELQFLTKYIEWSTPMLLNEFDGISPIIDVIKKHDVLKTRISDTDDRTTRFHSMENIEGIFNQSTQNTPYGVLSTVTNISNLGGIKPDLKRLVYKFLVRLDELNSKDTSNIHKTRLEEYISYLFDQNSGHSDRLGTLYDMTKQAIMDWDGQFDDENICIDDSNERYWILEQLSLQPYLPNMLVCDTNEIQRFSPVLKIGFGKEDGDSESAKYIGIDFSMYELISDMKNGYRPTVQDKNYHADFVSYIKKLIEFGNKGKRISIVSKNGELRQKAEFSKTAFGYKFKVV